jgi:hypothetical protein
MNASGDGSTKADRGAGKLYKAMVYVIGGVVVSLGLLGAYLMMGPYMAGAVAVVGGLFALASRNKPEGEK